jgi:hypothetical protein
VELRRELHAGRTGADDRDVELPGFERHRLGVRAYARVDEPMVKALGLFGRVEADRMLARARCAEIIGAAADRDDERVVVNLAARNQLFTVELVVRRADFHGTPRAVQTVHRAQLKFEVVPARLREVIEIVLVQVHAAGGDFVQQRLP